MCVETSGFAGWEAYAAILPYVDRFLFDVKETDEERHRRYTGVGMGAIRENLRRLDEGGAALVLRCPIIPGVNDREDHFRAIAELAGSLRGALEIDLEPYHPLGIGKAERIGGEIPYRRREPMDRQVLADWQRQMSAWTQVPVVVQQPRARNVSEITGKDVPE